MNTHYATRAVLARFGFSMRSGLIWIGGKGFLVVGYKVDYE